MHIERTGIFIGHTQLIAFYGVLIAVGAFIGAWLASREARRRGVNPDLVWDGMIWVLIGGIIGARLWHVFTPPPSMIAMGRTTEFYLTHPFDLLWTRDGGLGIPGAIILGGLALWVFTRRRKMSFALWADIAAPGLALGQAIGRWGNFINQEVYGAPTNLPWKLYIEPAYRYYTDKAYYHPLFLYECILNLANMALLLWMGRRFADRLKTGDLFLTYLVVYPTGRFFLEFLRLDASRLGGLNANQTLMAVVALIAAGLLAWRHWPRGGRAKAELRHKPRHNVVA